MKNILFLFFAFCYCFHSGQKKKNPKDLLDAFSNDRFYKDFKPITFNNRIKKFPFNKTSKIKLISYNLDFKKEPVYTPQLIGDSIAIKNNENKKLPVELSDILANKNLEKAQQQKNLTLTEIQELSDIIFNECAKYRMGLFSKAGCYFPRNAILFYDENDKIFAHFEICFQCGGFTSDPKNLFEDDFDCDDIYSKLEVFFNKVGMQTQYKENK